MNIEISKEKLIFLIDEASKGHCVEGFGYEIEICDGYCLQCWMKTLGIKTIEE